MRLKEIKILTGKISGFNLFEDLTAEEKELYMSLYKEENNSDIFKPGVYRIFIPVGDTDSGDEIENEIRQELSKDGYVVVDYKKGTALKNEITAQGKESTRIFKIGKLLAKNNPFLLSKFEKDPARSDNITNKSKYTVVISRHPHDIATMTSERSWENQSCMNIRTGINRKYVRCDVESGTLVAYLTLTEELKGITDDSGEFFNSIGRMLIKPFYRNPGGEKLMVPENRIYGTGGSILKSVVLSWLKNVNKNIPYGEYNIVSNLYNDSIARSKIHNKLSEYQEEIEFIKNTINKNIYKNIAKTDNLIKVFNKKVKKSHNYGSFITQGTHYYGIRFNPDIFKNNRAITIKIEDIDGDEPLLFDMEIRPDEIIGEYTLKELGIEKLINKIDTDNKDQLLSDVGLIKAEGEKYSVASNRTIHIYVVARDYNKILKYIDGMYLEVDNFINAVSSDKNVASSFIEIYDGDSSFEVYGLFDIDNILEYTSIDKENSIQILKHLKFVDFEKYEDYEVGDLEAEDFKEDDDVVNLIERAYTYVYESEMISHVYNKLKDHIEKFGKEVEIYDKRMVKFDNDFVKEYLKKFFEEDDEYLRSDPERLGEEFLVEKAEDMGYLRISDLDTSYVTVGDKVFNEYLKELIYSELEIDKDQLKLKN